MYAEGEVVSSSAGELSPSSLFVQSSSFLFLFVGFGWAPTGVTTAGGSGDGGGSSSLEVVFSSSAGGGKITQGYN